MLTDQQPQYRSGFLITAIKADNFLKAKEIIETADYIIDEEVINTAEENAKIGENGIKINNLIKETLRNNSQELYKAINLQNIASVKKNM